MKTRMIKAQCGSCAYTVRLTRKWLEDAGPPLCPCNREPMEIPEGWDFEGWVAQQMEAVEVSGQTLKDKWVTLRSMQSCAGCRAELPHGESARHRSYVIDGEFFSDYTCANCDNRAAHGSRGVALARA